jgi:uncharacterized protein YndB with AHSA1/START domain
MSARALARLKEVAWIRCSAALYYSCGRMNNGLAFLLIFALGALAAGRAAAADVTPTGFLVRYELAIGAPPAKVYDSLIDVGSWWSEQHTYSGDSRHLSIDPRAGGCFCEKLPNGSVEHMRVVFLKVNEALRMRGALGPLQASGVSGAMTWRLSPTANGTKLELAYSVGGFMAGGFESIAPAVESVLREQADRLKRFVETGSPASK